MLFYFLVFAIERERDRGDRGERDRERGERRRRSRSRDRERHRRHRSRSREGRKRSRSKSPKNKSRRRKPSLYWDVPPPGFEHIAPLQYKAMQGNIFKSVFKCLHFFFQCTYLKKIFFLFLMTQIVIRIFLFWDTYFHFNQNTLM